MYLSKLTLMVFELTAALDTGKYDDISVEEVSQRIAAKDVISWLREHVHEADLSTIEDATAAEYGELLASLHGGYAGYERKKWGVENRGLCLLIAWTNQLIEWRKWTIMQ